MTASPGFCVGVAVHPELIDRALSWKLTMSEAVNGCVVRSFPVGMTEELPVQLHVIGQLPIQMLAPQQAATGYERRTPANLETEKPGISGVIAVSVGASAVTVAVTISLATAKKRPNGKVASDEFHSGSCVLGRGGCAQCICLGQYQTMPQARPNVISSQLASTRP